MPETNGDELFHYGVKGMKWGKRGASSSGGSSGPSRKELKGMDKKARSEDKAARKEAFKARDNDIVKARKDLPDAAKRVSDARKQYKIDKTQIGKVAARRALNKHKDEFDKTWDKAMERTGREATAKLIAGALGSSLVRP